MKKEVEMNMNITKYICDLIDKSNLNGIEQSVKETAIAQLIKLGVYNEDGEMITTNMFIIKHYEDNWC
jgi:hypothetical protein